MILYISAARTATSFHMGTAPGLTGTAQPQLHFSSRPQPRAPAGTTAAAHAHAPAGAALGPRAPARHPAPPPVSHPIRRGGLGQLVHQLLGIGAIVAGALAYGLGRSRTQPEPDAEAGLGLQPLFPRVPASGASPLAVRAPLQQRRGLALQATPSPTAGDAPALALCSAVANIPHPEKAYKGGEDSWFVQVGLDGGASAVGVADGVGGYAAEGTDAGVYAKVLMREAQSASEAQCLDALDPTAVLAAAQRATRLPGAAPAVVAQMLPDGRMLAANVGDCGFRVIRDGAILTRSEVGEHFFDCPHQLEDPDSGFDGVDLAEERAVVSEIQLRPGDVLLLASDGLYDNMHEAELLEIVARAVAPRWWATADRTAQGLADALAKRAAEHAQDPTYASPYGAEWTANQRALTGQPEPDNSLLATVWELAAPEDEPREGPEDDPWEGGKLDDITVVASVVVAAASNTAALAASAAAAARAKAYADAVMAPHLAQARIRLTVEKAQASVAAARAMARAAVDDAAPLKFSEADEEMLRKGLLEAKLRTSGLLKELKERVAEVRE